MPAPAACWSSRPASRTPISPRGASARRQCSRRCARGAGRAGGTRAGRLLWRRCARGVRLVGPNSLGVVNSDPAVALHALLGEVEARPGGLALSSQSGGLGLALLGHAAARRLGVAAFVSLGNRADVSTNDLLEYWADDPRCKVLALYVESFGNPRRFSQISRRVSRHKPIIAVKGNRGRAAASAVSHTAGAPGDEAAVGAPVRP